MGQSLRPIDAVKIFFIIVLAGVVFTIPIAIGWMVPIGWRRAIFYLPWLIWSRGTCIICRVDLRVRGRENIRQGFQRGHIFISNHQSALDIPLLVSIYPLPFLTKRENLFIPWVGLAGLLAGSIAFNRDKAGERRRVMDRIVERAKHHTSLFVFPEGTRSRDGELQQRIFPALLRNAWRAGVDVVPIAIHGSYLVVGHKSTQGGRYPVVMEVGPAIEASQFSDDRAFADHCWKQVIALHSNIAGEIAPAPASMAKKLVSSSAQ